MASKSLPSLRYAKHNIRRVYAAATSAEREEGMTWYDEATNLAYRLDPKNPDRAAGVIAALSPLTPWNRNVDLAEMAYTNGSADKTLTRSIEAANRIMAGEHPLAVLTSDKVMNFYLSIVRDPHAVCVDRHAFDVARGRKSTDAERQVLGRVGMYDRVADAYRVVAAELGIQPRLLQATVWVTWRRMHVTGRYRHLVPNVLTPPSAASAA